MLCFLASQHCIEGRKDAWCCPTHLRGPKCNMRRGCEEDFNHLGEGGYKYVGSLWDPDGYNITYWCASGYKHLMGDLNRRCLPDGSKSGHRPICGKELNGHMYKFIDHEMFGWNESIREAQKYEVGLVKGKVIDIMFPQEADLAWKLLSDFSFNHGWIGLHSGEWVTSAAKRSIIRSARSLPRATRRVMSSMGPSIRLCGSARLGLERKD